MNMHVQTRPGLHQHQHHHHSNPSSNSSNSISNSISINSHRNYTSQLVRTCWQEHACNKRSANGHRVGKAESIPRPGIQQQYQQQKLSPLAALQSRQPAASIKMHVCIGRRAPVRYRPIPPSVINACTKTVITDLSQLLVSMGGTVTVTVMVSTETSTNLNRAVLPGFAQTVWFKLQTVTKYVFLAWKNAIQHDDDRTHFIPPLPLVLDMHHDQII
ncbi:hypothetical protein FRC16_010294 [Serendipita sp. 398]|nr:hypothetical protein FRC16_010294 [Serendipita sp. 398]